MDDHVRVIGELAQAINQIHGERDCCSCLPHTGYLCPIHRITELIIHPNPHASEGATAWVLDRERLKAYEALAEIIRNNESSEALGRFFEEFWKLDKEKT